MLALMTYLEDRIKRRKESLRFDARSAAVQIADERHERAEGLHPKEPVSSTTTAWHPIQLQTLPSLQAGHAHGAIHAQAHNIHTKPSGAHRRVTSTHNGRYRTTD